MADLTPADYTLAHLQRIRAAKTDGTLRVQYADRLVEYRSIEELNAVEQEILRALGTPRGRISFGVGRNGF
ncbi:MAG TPA: hypothetical protein VHZ73_07715 [Vicinamibacterales bacterium]|nr:hypothetical protein [Vicinamibacterales bacterium]